MFTGLVEEIGKINKIIPGDKVREFIISARKITDGLIIGDSICVNGACLTVETTESNAFKVTAVEETLKRSTLKNFRIGSAVNLERALSFTDRLAGHLVQGHVDDVALVHAINKQGNAWILELALSPVLLRYTIEKGSIAVDGVSLTIAKKRGDLIVLTLIPHTFENTAFQYTKTGGYVNIEVDMFAKYVEQSLRIFTKNNDTKADWYKSLEY